MINDYDYEDRIPQPAQAPTGEREIVGAEKTIITFGKNDDFATVYTATPRMMEKLNTLCLECNSHYKALKTRLNSKGHVASKDYAVSVAMLGFLTPADKQTPSATAGKGGRQRRGKDGYKQEP